MCCLQCSLNATSNRHRPCVVLSYHGTATYSGNIVSGITSMDMCQDVEMHVGYNLTLSITQRIARTWWVCLKNCRHQDGLLLQNCNSVRCIFGYICWTMFVLSFTTRLWTALEIWYHLREEKEEDRSRDGWTVCVNRDMRAIDKK